MLSFKLFCISIGQFQDKMHLISSFTPGFSNLCSDRAGRSSHLISQGIPLFFRKSLAQFKYFPGHLPGESIDFKFTKALYISIITDYRLLITVYCRVKSKVLPPDQKSIICPAKNPPVGQSHLEQCLTSLRSVK